LLLTDDPVFLKRLAAPECVFSLYPILIFFLKVIYSFLEVTKPSIIAYLPMKALDPLEL